ncbi:MAG: alpha-glucan phosphorylase, partial [Spirochaetota bacterium]
GEDLEISADINLGPLSPEEIRVEAYFGHINSQGGIDNPQTAKMKPRDGQNASTGTLHYVARIPCAAAGRQGYSVRILPQHRELKHNLVPGYIKWA